MDVAVAISAAPAAADLCESAEPFLSGIQSAVAGGFFLGWIFLDFQRRLYPERDLLQKLKLLGGYFSDSGIQTEILQQQDIVRLCNLVNNPAYVHLEDSGINAAIPILESVGVA